ncbi:MAG: bifunctional diaminohydroxyphosphoribosylaminopyrimidine deaminase/5-amino-6-(5-phosphoribosylamino)uracil reductase RibD [Saprospiraceae bacterium]
MAKNNLHKHRKYIKRCFDLARLGAGSVAPNPLVGAVLVHQGKIIGEGWHKKYGDAHAEVNALANVADENRNLIIESTLYVSLEPCCIYGRTPPCTSLIINHKIPRVVISCLDQTPGVAGRGVELLREAGVEVITGILEKEGKALSQIRNTFVTTNRPYILLKWAQSADGFIGKSGEQVWLTQPITKRIVHKWRAETAAILVGTNTALTDNPQLTNRHYFGHSPLRIVLDRSAKIPFEHHLYAGTESTWMISEQIKPAGLHPTIEWKQLTFDDKLLQNLLELLAENGKSSLMVEGGSQLLNSFIKAGLWDEARIFTTKKSIHAGIAAPLIQGKRRSAVMIGLDKLEILYQNDLS